MICLLAFALVADAAGFAEARAPTIDVGALLPAVETTVPRNGRLVFIGAADATFVRVRADETGSVVDEVPLEDHEVVAVDQFESAHVVTLPASLALVVGEQLVVQSRCASCTFQGTWTVVDEDSSEPTFDDGPARVTGEHIGSDLGGTNGGWFITLELPGARDDRSATMIELRGDLNQVAPRAFAPGAPVSVFVTDLDDSERTACFDAFAIDAAGNETAFRDELCVELVRPFIGGCAQASSSSPVLASLLVFFVALRRRARRC